MAGRFLVPIVFLSAVTGQNGGFVGVCLPVRSRACRTSGTRSLVVPCAAPLWQLKGWRRQPHVRAQNTLRAAVTRKATTALLATPFQKRPITHVRARCTGATMLPKAASLTVRQPVRERGCVRAAAVSPLHFGLLDFCFPALAFC